MPLMQDPHPVTNTPDVKPASSGITDAPEGDGALIMATPPLTQAPATTPGGYRTAPDHTNAGWPPGVPYIVGNEACERFSYYGMRAILQVHLTSLFVLQYAAEDAQRF